ncbi:hypothetical protein ES705_38952 [subsurface metagenome]
MAIMGARFRTVSGRLTFYLLGIPLFTIMPIVAGVAGGFWAAVIAMLIGAGITMGASKAIDNLAVRKRGNRRRTQLHDAFRRAGLPEEDMPAELREEEKDAD